MSDKEERFHNCLHSDYLRDDYLTKFYLPELRGAEISCADPGLPMSRSNRALGWTISHKQALKTAFILGAATIGVLYSLRPAPLCDALFHCSMTISRIEYYPSAECVGDHRAYKANWITLNTYDFYLPRYRFKWVPQGPECDDPEATRLNQCRLQPKVYDSLSPDRDVKPTPQEGNMEYPISVRGGYSSYVADFHTEAGLTPTALGFSTPYVTKDVHLQILSDDIADKTSAAERIAVGGEQLCPKDAAQRCPCDVFGGNDVQCTGIYLQPGVTFSYTFQIQNWQQPCDAPARKASIPADAPNSRSP
jgi:hypothetical protein